MANVCGEIPLTTLKERIKIKLPALYYGWGWDVGRRLLNILLLFSNNEFSPTISSIACYQRLYSYMVLNYQFYY